MRAKKVTPNHHFGLHFHWFKLLHWINSPFIKAAHTLIVVNCHHWSNICPFSPWKYTLAHPKCYFLFLFDRREAISLSQIPLSFWPVAPDERSEKKNNTNFWQLFSWAPFSRALCASFWGRKMKKAHPLLEFEWIEVHFSVDNFRSCGQNVSSDATSPDATGIVVSVQDASSNCVNSCTSGPKDEFGQGWQRPLVRPLVTGCGWDNLFCCVKIE